MISNRYRYIFVHVPKAGGTTVKRALGDDPTIEENDWHHDLAHFKKMHRDRFDTFFKFAVARNPFDRLVSAYCYNVRLMQENDAIHWRHYGDLYRWLAASVEPGDLPGSFRRFVASAWFDKSVDDGFPIHFKPLTRFIAIEGRVELDYLARIETLEHDLRNIAKRIEYEFTGVSWLNKTPRADYQQFYDYRTCTIVRRAYAADFELLNL